LSDVKEIVHMGKTMVATMLTLMVSVALVAARLQVATPTLVGDWQGILSAGQGIRVVVKIATMDATGAKAMLYLVDQSPDGVPIASVTQDRARIVCVIASIGATIEGTSADGGSIHGTWIQGRNSVPLTLQRPTKETAWATDTSPHAVQLVTVDDVTKVRVEVLDWGGSGRPIVLLAGLGDTAHRFDRFATKLTGTYHVYGVTRRGFGASDAPAPENGSYSADRLGDDVLAVLDAFKLRGAVLMGHSIAGEEMSSIATRHPERVAGLVYLDAAYPYAFYDRSRGDLNLDALDARAQLAQLIPGMVSAEQEARIEELLQATLPRLEKDLREQLDMLQTTPVPPMPPQIPPVVLAVMAGERKYTEIHVPVLAIFAVPHDQGPTPQSDPAARAAAEARDVATTGSQADAFAQGIPSARVVRLPHASHYVFLSNEADVVRELDAFVGTLR
jgi:pimeloyl-ACP methyl ester carboxylesterase